MRLEVYEQIWHSFGVLHRHLLLMMDFDCHLAFRHKKGEYILRALCTLFFFFRGRVVFCLLELVELFRLYLGASLCTLPFQLLPHCFYFVGLFMLGGVYFVILVSNFLLIYDYEFFIIICLYCLCLIIFHICLSIFAMLSLFDILSLCILFNCQLVMFYLFCFICFLYIVIFNMLSVLFP